MKKRTKKALIATLSCGLLATSTLGVSAGFTAFADSVRVKPTGTNTNTLTQEINDADLDTFQIYGASTRTKEPNGFRFLATIEQSDLALIPNDAEFGMLLIPENMLTGELTKDTENALVAPAKIDTSAKEVPAGGLGYMITLMGETLEQAFPTNLYGTVIAARAYVKYTYTVDGETVTDYAYSAQTMNRSIAYVASCELVDQHEAGVPDTDESSFLNQIIAQTAADATFTFSKEEVSAGGAVTVDLENATDGVNEFDYALSSSNESVAIINDKGEIQTVGVGTTEITLHIGAKEITKTLTVKDAMDFTDGSILYSTLDDQIFMPDGLLEQGEIIVSAVGKDDGVTYYEKGEWDALAQSESEINANAITQRTLRVKTSNGYTYNVNAQSYAGIIDELSDFPAFFNNDSAATTPDVYGQYIVIKNLGTGAETLTYEQSMTTTKAETNGFNGVLDGLGHTLNFQLGAGGLVGYYLGTGTIKNLGITYYDLSYDTSSSWLNGGYGIFGYQANGAATIENCYINYTTANNSNRATTFGLIAVPNNKLILKGVVINNNWKTNNAPTWYPATGCETISSESENAFIINAHNNAINNEWAAKGNFTEIIVGNTLTDASGLDLTYFTTGSNRPGWRGMADTAVTLYKTTGATWLDEKALYSTETNELFLPTEIGGMENVVSITSETGETVYYEDGAWQQDFALTAEQILNNETAKTAIKIYDGETSYFVTVESYAGVIDELADFTAFFNNDSTATTPDVYGYYIVIKNLGTGEETLTYEQSMTTTGAETNGFNGVLDGLGHSLNFQLGAGGLVGYYLGTGTIKNLGITYYDVSYDTSSSWLNGGYGIFGYQANGAALIENCYINYTTANNANRATTFGLIAVPNNKLVLKGVVINNNWKTNNEPTWYPATGCKTISSESENAFIINAHNNAINNAWESKTYFTEIIVGNTLTDASVLDLTYWTNSSNRPGWRGADDMSLSVHSVEVRQVEITDKVFLYSTQNKELIGAEALLSDGETIVDAWVNDEDCFENDEWTTAVALSDEEITANATKTVTVVIKTSNGKFYQVSVNSYAGVINELDDFKTFFDNDAEANVPSLYGYYIVTSDLGTGTETLALTQSEIHGGTATEGFNGILDGQGHTLRFQLTSGALVGMVLGNGVIENLGVIFDDATTMKYGVFGAVANGAPVIRNCYIERTVDYSDKRTTFGIMDRPREKLILENTVVYGYYVKNDNTYQGETGARISPDSQNAYVINARLGDQWKTVNFTKVFVTDIWEGSRSMPLSEIADASGFDNRFWKKENGSLIWNAYETANVSWVDGDTVTVQAVTKGHYINVTESSAGYWSLTDGGDKYTGLLQINADTTLYAALSDTAIAEKALYSTINNELFLPTEVGGMENVVSITSESDETVYYENGVWYENFALTAEQIRENETAETAIKIYNGEINYFVTVESYAGVIDELEDFTTFFNNDPAATTPDVYGYYIVIKNLGTGEETLTYEQSMTTTGAETNGFNGVLDGLGHSLNFQLAKGGLVGYYLGTGTIKNLGITYYDVSYDTSSDWLNGGYGIFGYQANGAALIENCYINYTTANNANRATTFGLIAVPNNKLVLKGVVINNNWKTNNEPTWYPATGCKMISSESENAFIINAHNNAINNAWESKTYFTEIIVGNTLTDASVLDLTYWTTGNNIPGWRGADDKPVASVGKVNVTATHLVNEGATKYAIVLPASADANLEKAAEELQLFFAEATGAELEIASDLAYDNYGMYISIGNTRVFQSSGISLDGVEKQGYRIERIDNMIYIHGGSTLGSLYGVYGLLEELFGYKQYSIDCYNLSSNPTVELSEITTATKNPSIAARVVSNGAMENDSDYANRMKMANTRYVLPAGDYNLLDYGGAWETYHNALEILPYKYWLTEQGKTNWYSRTASGDIIYVDADGNVNYTGNGSVAQLCYTAGGIGSDDYNAMVAQIVDVMTLSLATETYSAAKYPEAVYITLTSEDNELSCECSGCQAAIELYGSASGAVIKLCNDVREGLETWMNENTTWKRDLTLLFFAYNAYVTAPTLIETADGGWAMADGTEMRSDVGVYYAVSDYVNYYYDIEDAENADFLEQFNAWAKLTGTNDSPFCLWLYTKNFGRYMLRVDVYGESGFFNENAYKYFEEAGVDLLWNQGASNGTTTLSAFEKLNGFIDSQLGWNREQSVTSLIDEWFAAMYGDAADAMRALYDSQNSAAWEVFDTSKEGIPTCWPDKSDMRGGITESTLEEWFGYIDEAKAAINATSLSDAEKAVYIERINEEWISIEFWYVWLYYQTTFDSLVDGVTVDVAAEMAKFREVLGYDSTTGTYAKDVTLLENAGCTLTEWIDSKFTESL